MAWSITLNKDGRQCLAGVLRGLLITQLVISLIMAIFCYNSSVKVLSLLEKIHKFTVFLLYGLLLLQAYCTKLHYTSGFRIITWLLRYPHWERTAAVTKLWIVSGTLIAANGLLVHAACKNIVKRLMKELSYTLRVGISQYLTEHNWKVLLDTLQVELNCCGVENPNDWHEIHWLNVDFFNEESEIVMELAGVDGKLLPPVSPYSCCTAYVLTACYHDPFQQIDIIIILLLNTVLQLTEFSFIYVIVKVPAITLLFRYQDWRERSSALTAASLSGRGCVRAVATPLAHVVFLLQALSLIMLLLQIIIVVLTLVLRDSTIDSQEQVRHEQQFRSEISMGRGIVGQRRSMRRVRSRGYACLS